VDFSDVVIRVRFDTLRRQVEEAVSGGARWSGTGRPPAFDVYETADAVLLVVDLPGVPPDLLDIRFAERCVIVRGERPDPGPEGGRVPHRLEITTGPFELRVRLPVPVDPVDARARCALGVVTVTLPKRRE
jgi:HSP20 family protein